MLLAFPESSIPGGVFAPALAVGAGIGSSIASFMPVAEHGSALLALGMVAFRSAWPIADHLLHYWSWEMTATTSS